jgi:hypothetical protein
MGGAHDDGGTARLDDALVRFLRSGCTPIVGCVDTDGAPIAMRGWGLHAEPGGSTLRLLLDADDLELLDRPAVGEPIAVTATSVPTLRSVQMKGRVTWVGPPEPLDLERMQVFLDAMFGDIVAADGFPRAVLERWRPAEVGACTVAVDAIFDQTPGPLAGSPLVPERS